VQKEAVLKEDQQQQQDQEEEERLLRNLFSTSWLSPEKYHRLLVLAHESTFSFSEEAPPKEVGAVYFTRRSKRPWQNEECWRNCGRKKELNAKSSTPIENEDELVQNSEIDGIRMYYRVHKLNPNLRKRMVVLKNRPEIVLHHSTVHQKRTKKLPFEKPSKKRKRSDGDGDAKKRKKRK